MTNMKRGFICTGVALLSLIVLDGTSSGNGFLENPHWDSGKAEFQVYEASLGKYGIPRDATAKMILVKELFDPKALVKTRRSDNSISVLKLNFIQHIPAGIYDYFQMVSVFFERGTGRVLKYTMSSQDGCGNTFLEYLRRGDKHLFRYHTYWDGQGDMEMVLEDTEFTFYDSLPVALRFRLPEAGEYRLKIMDALIANKAVPLTIREGTVRNRSVTNRKVGDKTYQRVFVSEVLRDGKKDVLVFEPDFPHRLLEWKKAGGDKMLINQSHFLYYWEHVKPEDRSLGLLKEGKSSDGWEFIWNDKEDDY